MREKVIDEFVTMEYSPEEDALKFFCVLPDGDSREFIRIDDPLGLSIFRLPYDTPLGVLGPCFQAALAWATNMIRRRQAAN